MINHRHITDIGGMGTHIRGNGVAVIKNEIDGTFTLQHTKDRVPTPVKRSFCNENSLERFVATHIGARGQSLLSSVLGDMGVAGFSGIVRGGRCG